jgi:hypothetical protein
MKRYNQKNNLESSIKITKFAHPTLLLQFIIIKMKQMKSPGKLECINIHHTKKQVCIENIRASKVEVSLRRFKIQTQTKSKFINVTS